MAGAGEMGRDVPHRMRGRGGFESVRGGRGRGRDTGGHEMGRARDAGYATAPSATMPTQNPTTPAVPPPATAPTVAGLAGLGEYATSNSASDESSSEESSSDSSSDTSDSEPDNDNERKIDFPEPAPEPVDAPVNQEQPVCRYWAKKGRCRLGNRCPDPHPVSRTIPSQESAEEMLITRRYHCQRLNRNPRIDLNPASHLTRNPIHSRVQVF